MKTPVWVWDWKQKKYLRLPPGLVQFEDGNWGFLSEPWPEKELILFLYEYNYLFRIEPEDPFAYWQRAVLIKRGPEKYQPNKDKARITKVQR